jgi:hypothetical protein
MTSQPVEATTADLVRESRRRARLRRVVVGLLPLWMIAVASIASPGFTKPLFEKPPEFVGLPAGMVWLGLAFAVMAVGVAVLWLTTSNAVAFLVLLFLTLPTTAVSILLPAIVLIMQNLRA